MLGWIVKLVSYGLQLLGDSLGWLDHESSCSALFTPVGQAQDGIAQRIQGTWGLAVGGMTSDTHDKLHGLRSRGGPAHKTKTYGA